MSTDIRFKRGTTAAVQAYSQSAGLGEPVFDIEKKRLYIGTDTTIEEIGGDHFSVEDDTLDDINDGTTYGKVANLDLTSNRVDFDKLTGFSAGMTEAYLNQLVDGFVDIHGWQGIAISDTTGSYDAFTITNAGGDAIQINNATAHGINIATAGSNAINVTNSTTNGLQVVDAGNHGIIINNATVDGIRITTAGNDAIQITNSTVHGINIANAGSHGITIQNATTNALNILTAGTYAIGITNSTDDAIHITNAGDNAIGIDDSASHAILIANTSAGDALHITNAFANGIAIDTAGSDAIEISNATAHGILITDAGADGLHITTATDSAIEIDNAGAKGILVSNATSNGIQVTTAGGSGVLVSNATSHGIAVLDAGSNAINVATATSNGLQIVNAGNCGIVVSNATVDGIKVTTAGGDAIQITNSTLHGLQIANAGSNGINITTATSNAIRVIDAGNYGISLAKCTTGAYGPLYIENAGVSGASNLNTTYSNAAVDTLAVDSNHDLYIKTAAGTWSQVGASAAAAGVVDSSVISGTASSNNAVIIDANGLTMRKGAGAVRFDVNEDGSFTLGNAAGDRIAFTTGDAMTITGATLSTCTLDADSNTVSNLEHGAEVDEPSSGVHGVAGSIVGTSDTQTLTNKTLNSPKFNEDVVMSSTSTHLNQLDGVTVGGSSVGDIVTIDDTQTLTNKSISGEQIDSGTVAAARIADLSATYAVVALGVTNGNSHDHSGGDGSQINHTTLSNIGSNSHATIDSHISATAAHGATGAVVGTTNPQTLTSKSIDADNNTISNLEHGAEVDNPSSGVHGVSGSVVGTTDIQTLTNKSIQFGQITTGTVGTNVQCIFTGHASTPSIIKWGTSTDKVNWYYNNTNRMDMSPTSANTIDLYIGDTTYKYAYMKLYAGSSVVVSAYTSAAVNSYLYLTPTAASLRANTNLDLQANFGGTAYKVVLTSSNEFRPDDASDTTDLGTSSYGWDQAYANNWGSPAEFAYMDKRKDFDTGEEIYIDDLATIESIKPRGDYSDKNGFMLIDDNTIPEWLIHRGHKTGKLEYNSKNQPIISLNTWLALALGAIRQLNRNDKNNMNTILDKLIQLEKKLEELK